MTALTYFQFHLLFVAPPLLLLAGATARRAVPAVRVRVLGRRLDARVVGVGLMILLALVYTTPWDSYLIQQGAWGYGEGAVAARFLAVPLGEYLFFVVQTVLTALWLYLLPTRPAAGDSVRITVGQRALGIGAGGLFVLAGWLIAARPSGLYLGTLLLWAGPVLALQWGFGWPYLWRLRRTVALGVGAPTLYLWLADRAALAIGVWHLSPELTTGLALPVLGLPIEEAAFFLLTNLFVVQGLVLWLWVSDRWL
jgi:lycopene cyclase domain-containing protein